MKDKRRESEVVSLLLLAYPDTEKKTRFSDANS